MIKLTYKTSLTLAVAIAAVSLSPAYAQKAAPTHNDCGTTQQAQEEPRRGGRLLGAVIGAARIYGAVESSRGGNTRDLETATNLVGNLANGECNQDLDGDGRADSTLVTLGEAAGLLDEDDADTANALMPLVSGNQSQSKSNEKSLQERPVRRRPTRTTRAISEFETSQSGDDEAEDTAASNTARGGGIYNAAGNSETRALLLPAIQKVREAAARGESVDADHDKWIDILQVIETAEPQDRMWLRAQLIAAGIEPDEIDNNFNGDGEPIGSSTGGAGGAGKVSMGDRFKSLQERPRRERPTRSGSDRDVDSNTGNAALLLPAVQSVREAASHGNCFPGTASETLDGCQMCPPGTAAATGDANLDGDFDADDLGAATSGGTEDINIGVGELQECSNAMTQNHGYDRSTPDLILNAAANNNQGGGGIFNNGGVVELDDESILHTDRLDHEESALANEEDGEIVLKDNDEGKALQERPRRERPARATEDRDVDGEETDESPQAAQVGRGRTRARAQVDALMMAEDGEAAPLDALLVINQADDGEALMGDAEITLKAGANAAEASRGHSFYSGSRGGGIAPEDEPQAATTVEMLVLMAADEEKAEDDSKSLQERPRRARPTRASRETESNPDAVSTRPQEADAEPQDAFMYFMDQERDSGDSHLDYLTITMENTAADGETCEGSGMSVGEGGNVLLDFAGADTSEASMSGGAGNDIFFLGSGDRAVAERQDETATDARTTCSNNLRQLGTANH